jgi:hypothetical protein
VTKWTHLVLPLAAGSNSLDTAILDTKRSSDSERYLLTGSRSSLKAGSSICGFTGLFLLLLLGIGLGNIPTRVVYRSSLSVASSYF